MAVRNGKKVEVWGWKLRVDGKDSTWYVLVDEATKESVARQTKKDAGRRYRQGTNPDYEGYLTYPLEFRTSDTANWTSWSEASHKGDMLSTRFLEFLAQRRGISRPK